MSARSQSDLLQSLVEALPFGVYVLDAQGRIVVWNQAVERITGYLAQTMVGRLLDQDLLVCSEIESTSRRSAIRHNGVPTCGRTPGSGAGALIHPER